jgi:phage terminase large subunit-like protein
MLVITTAGDDVSGPCYAHQSELQQVLEGVIEDEQRFGVIFTIDDGDDWTSEEALVKANPNFGVSIDPEFLLVQQRDAVGNARKQATFQTKHLNMWVASASPWLPMQAWKEAGDKALRIEDFDGEECWDGVDLANTTDIASRCKCFKRIVNGEEHYYFFWRHYLPENIILQPENKHYQGWQREGWIIATPGSMIDQPRIERDIVADAEKFVQKEIAFDLWGAPGIIGNLQNEGFEVLTVPLRASHLSAPMKWIDGLLKSRRLHHNGDPVAAWAVNNVQVRPDQNDNWFPKKPTSRSKKTDPAVAMILAVSRAMVGGGQEASVYETRGVVVI